MADVVAEGVWCRNCEFFEEDPRFAGVQCLACGCDASDHAEAAVTVLPEDEDAPVPVEEVNQ